MDKVKDVCVQPYYLKNLRNELVHMINILCLHYSRKYYVARSKVKVTVDAKFVYIPVMYLIAIDVDWFGCVRGIEFYQNFYPVLIFFLFIPYTAE